MVMSNKRGGKYLIQDKPRMNDIMFKDGTKYTRRKGNKELEGEINQNMDTIQK